MSIYTACPLQPGGGADGAGLPRVLAVGGRDGRDLHLLAQHGDVHGLPAADAGHLLQEQAGGAGGVHVALDALVVDGALLEDADAVVVGAAAVVGVAEGRRHDLVGEALQLRLQSQQKRKKEIQEIPSMNSLQLDRW